MCLCEFVGFVVEVSNLGDCDCIVMLIMFDYGKVCVVVKGVCIKYLCYVG